MDPENLENTAKLLIHLGIGYEMIAWETLYSSQSSQGDWNSATTSQNTEAGEEFVDITEDVSNEPPNKKIRYEQLEKEIFGVQ